MVYLWYIWLEYGELVYGTHPPRYMVGWSADRITSDVLYCPAIIG